MRFFTKERVINNVVLLPIKDILKNPSQPRVIFSKEDIVSLTDRQESKRAFLSDYAMLRLISNPNEIKKEVNSLLKEVAEVLN